MDRFEELSTFVRVVESGSITRAAQRMGVAKSAVSRRLRELEERLKTSLVIRSTAALHLTEGGKAFYKQAVRILADLDEAELMASDANVALHGTIKLTAPLTLTTRRLMPLFNDFLELHTGLALEIDLNDRRVDLIEDGFDLAIRSGSLEDTRLVVRRLAPMKRVTCAAPSYLEKFGTPLTPEELSDHLGLVSTNLPEQTYWQYQWSGGQTVLARPKTRLKANNGEALLTAAVAGLGICAIPVFIASEAIEQGKLVPLLQSFPLKVGAIYAAYPPERYLSHRIRVLVDFLVDRLQELPLITFDAE
jgi:DNA-binding transcriptional LysR family regulator